VTHSTPRHTTPHDAPHLSITCARVCCCSVDEHKKLQVSNRSRQFSQLAAADGHAATGLSDKPGLTLPIQPQGPSSLCPAPAPHWACVPCGRAAAQPVPPRCPAMLPPAAARGHGSLTPVQGRKSRWRSGLQRTLRGCSAGGRCDPAAGANSNNRNTHRQAQSMSEDWAERRGSNVLGAGVTQLQASAEHTNADRHSP
jgi:hypothetical protein